MVVFEVSNQILNRSWCHCLSAQILHDTQTPKYHHTAIVRQRMKHFRFEVSSFEISKDAYTEFLKPTKINKINDGDDDHDHDKWILHWHLHRVILYQLFQIKYEFRNVGL